MPSLVFSVSAIFCERIATIHGSTFVFNTITFRWALALFTGHLSPVGEALYTGA